MTNIRLDLRKSPVIFPNKPKKQAAGTKKVPKKPENVINTLKINSKKETSDKKRLEQFDKKRLIEKKKKKTIKIDNIKGKKKSYIDTSLMRVLLPCGDLLFILIIHYIFFLLVGCLSEGTSHANLILMTVFEILLKPQVCRKQRMRRYHFRLKR